MEKKILILGGLGNGSVIANAIIDANRRGTNDIKFAGYLNDRAEAGGEIKGLPVLGRVEDCKKFVDQGYYFINTIYKIDGQQERIDMFESLYIPDDRLCTFIHPWTYIAPDVVLGNGTVVMPNVCISSGTSFGKGCLIMVGVTIGHDNVIGNFCHFAAQSCIGAYSVINDGVHIGLNATTRENLVLGKNSTLGMGAVLTKNIGENEIWAGNPAKFLRLAQ